MYFLYKGNTTRKKTIPVAWYLIQVPRELLKRHRDIIMTADILFVNTIPFFLTLSGKIVFPWYTILRTGDLRQYTQPSMMCISTKESGYL